MRVLVVEDEKKIADSIKKGLEQESYAVDVVYDGDQGYGVASVEDYDLIILDLMLPGLNGLEVCKKLRQEKISTPILMLTARGELEDRVKGLNFGADDYLVKPFNFEELLARLRALSRRPKKVLNNVLQVGNLSLDTINFQVKYQGNIIKLSKKEFSLLKYLMSNKGRVLSKDLIIRHVWNFDADILPNTVEVFIGYLRKKLGKPDLIKTIRGFGYKIG